MAIFTPAAQVFPGDIRLDTSTQQADLGARAETSDGRVFRYSLCGATAVVAGKLYDGPATIANHSNVTVQAAAAVGASQISVTLGGTAATLNQYANGVIVINDVDGEGFTYSIKSHPAADASATLTLTLDEGETVVTALTTSSQATLVANQYNGIIIHAAAETGIPVGVGNTQITAAQYGWIQTHGVVSCLHDVSVASLGEAVAASATTNGAVTAGTGALSNVGYSIVLGVSTEYNPIFLTID